MRGIRVRSNHDVLRGRDARCEGGYAIQIARWSEQRGASALHVSSGDIFPHPRNPAGPLPMTAPTMTPPIPPRMNGRRIPIRALHRSDRRPARGWHTIASTAPVPETIPSWVGAASTPTKCWILTDSPPVSGARTARYKPNCVAARRAVNPRGARVGEIVQHEQLEDGRFYILVAGLVAITPAAGTCGPAGAIAIGAIAGGVCFLAATRLKRRFGYDDALDVFGVHAVGGLVGALLTGVFAAEAFGGSGLAAGRSIASQLGYQALACGITIALSAGVTWILLRLIDRFANLRVGHDEEHEGLDLVLHNERGYIL